MIPSLSTDCLVKWKQDVFRQPRIDTVGLVGCRFCAESGQLLGPVSKGPAENHPDRPTAVVRGRPHLLRLRPDGHNHAGFQQQPVQL